MTTKNNNVHSLLITEIIRERINQMMSNNEHPMHILFEINDLLAELKGQEIKNIEAAFREGYMTTDRWSLDLEVFDHIKMRYDQDTMTYDEYYEAKKSAIFFRTNFDEKEVTNG